MCAVRLFDEAALENAFAPERVLPQAIPYNAAPALSVVGPTDLLWEAGLVDLLVTLAPEWKVPYDCNDHYRKD